MKLYDTEAMQLSFDLEKKLMDALEIALGVMYLVSPEKMDIAGEGVRRCNEIIDECGALQKRRAKAMNLSI